LNCWNVGGADFEIDIVRISGTLCPKWTFEKSQSRYKKIIIGERVKTRKMDIDELARGVKIVEKMDNKVNAASAVECFEDKVVVKMGT